MFGREARYPSEVPESYEVNRTVEDVLGEEVVFPGIKLKDKIYETVRANAQTAVNKTKARKEAAGAVRHTFTLGEKVLRKNRRSQQRKGGKMDRDLLGPFTITAVQGKSADLTDEKGKVFPSISLDHLVPYTEEFPRVPHKVLSRVAPGRPASPAPAVVSRGSPAPAVISRGSPAPAVVRQGSPAPAVVRRGSPAPAVVRQGSPAPAVVSRGSPAPAVVRR
ncbi:hypothetical protein AOXY_G12923 [Acipenser oxyrinchus oxyrinchus]|uniref:Uncharacterized protein n=1 Tax=Acipenser oxyrinchus oxyrinchus TaxID=40147 RepID=A0AAD8DAR6_ACIOX|nr:hypothetical protein AOXY_G12923 [Acipenser oxyrinchus oxyrinchus]